MANLVQNAQSNSGFLAQFNDEGFTDPYAYKLRTNLQPQGFLPPVKSAPQQGIKGDIVRFKVPRIGVWKGAYIHVKRTYKPTAASAVICAAIAGGGFIDRIELRSRDRILSQLVGNDIFFHVLQNALPITGMGRFGTIDDDINNTVSTGELQNTDAGSFPTNAGLRFVGFVIPLPFSIFSSKRQYLFTKFLEELEIHVHVAARGGKVKVFQQFGTWPDDISEPMLQLVCEYMEPSESTTKLLLNEAKLPRLQDSSYLEPVAELGMATTLTMDITCPYPTYRTHFYFIRDAYYDGDAGIHGYGTSMLSPDPTFLDKAILLNVSVYAEDKKILSLDTTDLVFHTIRNKTSPLTTTYGGAGTFTNVDTMGVHDVNKIFMYTIHWSDFMSEVSGGTKTAHNHAGEGQAGCIPWKHLSTPKIKFTFTRSGTSFDFYAVVSHKYHQLFETDIEHGVITNTVPF